MSTPAELISNLSSAIEKGDEKVTREIIEKLNSINAGPEPSSFSINPRNENDSQNFWLLKACRVSCLSLFKKQIAQLLVSLGAKLDVQCKNTESPLIYLLRYTYDTNNVEIALWMIENGAPVNQLPGFCGNSRTPLTMLVEEMCSSRIRLNFDSPDIILFEKLLKFGADINSQDETGNTPLTLAAVADSLDPELIEYLLKIDKIDVNGPNKQGQTAIELLAAKGKFLLTEKFLQMGAKFDQNKPSWIPLMIAVLKNDLKQVQEFYRSNDSQPQIAADKNVQVVFDNLIKQGKREFALEMLNWPGFLKGIKKGEIIEGATIDRLFRETIDELADIAIPHLCSSDIQQKLNFFKRLIRLGARYQCPGHLQKIIKSNLSFFLINETIDEQESLIYKEFIHCIKKARSQLFLFNRFGFEYEVLLEGGGGYSTNTNAGNDFSNAILELQKRFHEFISNSTVLEKLKSGLKVTLSNRFPDLNQDDIPDMLDKMRKEVTALCTTEWYGYLKTRLNEKRLLIVPLTTRRSLNAWHAEAIAVYDDMFFILDRSSNFPGVCFYRIKNMDNDKFLDKCSSFLDTFKESSLLSIQTFENDILGLLEDEGIIQLADDDMEHHARKKQSVENCCWATSKLFVYLVALITIYEFCKKKGLEFQNCKTTIQVLASFCYKEFTKYDRNQALADHCTLLGFNAKTPVSLFERLDYLKRFMPFLQLQLKPENNVCTLNLSNGVNCPSGSNNSGQSNRPDTSSKESKISADTTNLDTITLQLVQKIHSKHLDQCFFQYLNRREIDKALKLLSDEKQNVLFKPLIYLIKKLGRFPVDIDCIEKVFMENRWVSDADESGDTILHMAASCGQVNICEKILKYKALNQINLRATNLDGWTALHIAINKKQVETVRLLVKSDQGLLTMKVQFESSEILPIQMACLVGDIEVVKTLLELGANVNDIDLKSLDESNYTDSEYLGNLRKLIEQENTKMAAQGSQQSFLPMLQTITDQTLETQTNGVGAKLNPNP